MVLGRPARTLVLPAPQNPDGLTIAPTRRSDESSADAFIPDKGQGMNRTIKDATVERYFYETHDQLRTTSSTLTTSPDASRRLRVLTPYAFVCKRWTIEPKRFRLNPLRRLPGLNT
jgi:hypothetical protein